MSDVASRRPLGSTGIPIGPVTIGTSPLASMARLYGYEVGEERAIATVEAVLDSPIGSLDTSNGYGEDGAAERRVGAALARRGGLPADVLLATKVDPDPVTGDFSGDRVRRSLEESLERLGVDRIELLHLHDPERMTFAEATAPGGAVDALAALRDEGLVGHLGVAGGPVPMLRDYVGTGVFEVVLTHNRFTLLDRSAAGFFAELHDAGVGVLNAAPYGGGMLAKGPDTRSGYAYGTGDPRLADAARAMQAACERAGVPLIAAALQFSLRAPSVDSTVVGVSSPENVASTIALAATEIPEELWAELESLVPPSELWLD